MVLTVSKDEDKGHRVGLTSWKTAVTTVCLESWRWYTEEYGALLTNEGSVWMFGDARDGKLGPATVKQRLMLHTMPSVN